MRGLFSDVSQISTLRSVGVFAGVFLSLVAGITPGHCGALNNSSDIVYDFHQGLLEWSGEWDTDAGQDSYSDYYRVDRLRGGYVIRDHSSFCTGTAHDYFLEQVDQIIRPYSECGFWDDEHGNWVRKLLWSETSGWCGMVPHDWKYSLELEEGALMAAMISGVQSMNIHCAGELEYVHAYLNPDGSIDDLILEDNPCEYGLALSSLALGARLFAGQMIVGYDAIGEQAYEDMILVHRHIGKNLVVYDKPSFNTGYILKGLVNAYLTYREHSGTDREQAQLLGMIDEIVASYKRNQEVTGRFYILSSLMERYPVQQQLKADIALMLAHRITGDPSIPAAVKRNIDWVMTDRRDRSGKCMSGIVWASDDTTSFFECHQMWFMTVTAYLEEATGFDYSMCRAEAFTFLTDDNYAGIDLYDHNATQYGAFFAYRMISSDGTIQNETENCFKGAYEIGASLWAMALNYDLSVEGYTRLITQPPAGESDGWDKAIFTEHDFGPGNMVFQWDVQFMDVSSDGAFTGLFNDQNGDWRVMFSTGSGLQYRNTLDQERGLFDSSRLQSGMTYTVRVTKSNMNCVIFAVLENGIEVMREQMDDIMPFDACYFGVLQCNAEGAEAGNILVDNIMFQQSADPPCVNLLSQNVPNPFNAHTTISFDIGMAGQVTLDIYDPVGRFITRLVDATLARNNYTANWDGTNWRGRAVSSGVYFYVLKGEKHSEKKKMILLR